VLISLASANEADDRDAEMLELLIELGPQLKAGYERALRLEREQQREQQRPDR
jgi:hypothetical protein